MIAFDSFIEVGQTIILREIYIYYQWLFYEWYEVYDQVLCSNDGGGGQSTIKWLNDIMSMTN